MPTKRLLSVLDLDSLGFGGDQGYIEGINKER